MLTTKYHKTRPAKKRAAEGLGSGTEANFVSAGLTNEDCCLPTCALHKCGAGWFNSSLAGNMIRITRRRICNALRCGLEAPTRESCGRQATWMRVEVVAAETGVALMTH